MRFELVEGKVSKFWEVRVDGRLMTVRYGRIGSDGQERITCFASADEAQRARDRLVREKTGKGYHEMATPSVLGPLAAPPSSAAPVAAAEDGIDWPRGGFDWDAEMLQALPVVRGVHVPPRINAAACLTGVLSFDVSAFLSDLQSFQSVVTESLPGWCPWDADTVTARTAPDALQLADTQHWLELYLQALFATARRSGHPPAAGLEWASHAGVALHGLPFMVQVALALGRVARLHAMALSRTYAFVLMPLRSHLAASDDAEHAATMAVLERDGGGSAVDRMLRAVLAPHRAGWALESLVDGSFRDRFFLRTCQLPAEQMRAYLAEAKPTARHLRSVLLLQARIHGEAAAPLVADVLRRADKPEDREALAALALRLRAPQMVSLFVELLERAEARDALAQLQSRHPAAVLLCLVQHMLAQPSARVESWAVRLALQAPGAWTLAGAALAAAPRERFDRVLAAQLQSDAPVALLPAVLRDPPWLNGRRAAALPTLDLPAPASAERLLWSAEERARHAACAISGWWAPYREAPSAEQALARLGVAPEARARLGAGAVLQADDLKLPERSAGGTPLECLLLLPDAAALALWNGAPARLWLRWGSNAAVVRALLARHGLAALPGLLAYAQCHADDGLASALGVDSPRLVPLALHALCQLKKAKAAAAAWLTAHADSALPVVLALAFGREGAREKLQRANAQEGLRWFVAQGFTSRVQAEAAAGGPGLAQALQALLDTDPLQVLPARLPRVPAYLDAALLRRPVLAGSGATLPFAAVEHVVTMLAISTLEAPYAGLAAVREACTPDSLASFAWSMFNAWTEAGSPSSDAWAFTALGLLGDDGVARRLAPLIRAWPGDAAHARAVTGLDVLAAIGTDVALMHLDGIATKLKFKALQQRARERIAALAEARGLSPAELADRLVPDLGCDAQGTQRLDFGPRHFFVTLDDALKAVVSDAQGQRLKDLPKPTQVDDAMLAHAATARFKQLKADARALAQMQAQRLEAAMVSRRRWSLPEFQCFIALHPLMRRLASRLVWGQFSAGDALLASFRLLPDGTLAGPDGALLVLPHDAQIGIPHVLELPARELAACTLAFAARRVQQPFKQLARETYALTDAERAVSDITRFDGLSVPSRDIMRLLEQGWQREEGGADASGHVYGLCKPLAGRLEAQLALEPGIPLGMQDAFSEQCIPRISLHQRGADGTLQAVTFAQLAPALASDLLRDVQLLRG